MTVISLYRMVVLCFVSVVVKERKGDIRAYLPRKMLLEDPAEAFGNPSFCHSCGKRTYFKVVFVIDLDALGVENKGCCITTTI